MLFELADISDRPTSIKTNGMCIDTPDEYLYYYRRRTQMSLHKYVLF